MGTEQNNWLWKVREEKTLLFSLNDHFEKDSELQKCKRPGPKSHITKKWLQMCCDWTAVETQSKLGLSSWILFILIYHLPSFLGAPFSFHRVQPTFFLPFGPCCLSCPFLCHALPFPFCLSLLPLFPCIPPTSSTLRSFLFPPSLPAFSLAGHPHVLQYARGWEKGREKQRGERGL